MLAPDGSKFGERLLYLFAVFMAGYLVATRRRWLAALVSSRWALVAAVIAAVVHIASPLGSGYGPQSVLITAAGVVLLARASRAVADHRAMLPLRFAGRNSIVFYVSHYPVIAVVVTVASGVGMDTWGATAVLGAVVALTVATLLSLLRTRSLVSWLFTFPARGPGPAVRTRPDATGREAQRVGTRDAVSRCPRRRRGDAAGTPTLVDVVADRRALDQARPS